MERSLSVSLKQVPWLSTKQITSGEIAPGDKEVLWPVQISLSVLLVSGSL